MKKIIFFVVVFSLLFVLNCGLIAKEVLKIGSVFSVTGANAWIGEPEKNTALMLVDKYNKSHKDKQIELIIYDDEGDATKAQSFVTKLIEEDQCVAVIGPSITGTSLKVIDIATENKTPLISCASAAAIVDPVTDRKWIFKTAPLDNYAVDRLYKYITSKGMKKIAIISVSNGFGQSGKAFLESMASKYNISIVENQTFGAQDTDMKAQLTKIKSAKPDAIICWGTNPGPAYVVRNVKELGITIPLFQSHGVANKKYIELAGDGVEGTYLVAGKLLVYSTLKNTEKQKPILAQYTKEYMDKFKEFPSTFGGHSWDAFTIISKAFDEGKITGKNLSDKRSSLRNYIENTKNFVGIGGVFNFSEKDHNGLLEESFAIIQVKKSDWNFVE